eukprot:TRINITY_DN25410_c0_g1_i2.p1 TRINITY_DN25410_c0_g1~~TRINITY_DN25410_c0_g1_i2.p1  ORF type:complete len:566 (-),score=114.01 TRINITY_DN25410_c0_g1_i2:76-1734(-)
MSSVSFVLPQPLRLHRLSTAGAQLDGLHLQRPPAIPSCGSRSKARHGWKKQLGAASGVLLLCARSCSRRLKQSASKALTLKATAQLEVEVPSRPQPPCSSTTFASPDFSGSLRELDEVKQAQDKLKEVTATGRQLCYVACARLQRGDFEGAQEALDQISKLPGIVESIGPGLADNLEARLRICQEGNVGWFLQIYIQSLGLFAFLRSGRLHPEVPEIWRTGITDFDDESYLLGLIGTLRELERYAVNRGQYLDLRSVRLCLCLAIGLEEALMQFNFRNSALRQRFDGVKYAVKKMESLVYEIDLARQRAGSDDTDELSEAAVEYPEATSINEKLPVGLLSEVKLRYDHFDSQREEVMKKSRDVIKAAKNAIYALHREDWKKADSELKAAAAQANEIYENLAKDSPILRSGFFSAALEELAEALAYREYRSETKLLSLPDLQACSGLAFSLTLPEYLGGIMDLTGEVGRVAIRSASQGKKGKDEIEACLACVEAVYDSIQILPYLPDSLGKKIGPLKNTMSKIEQVLYELALLSQGVKRSIGSEPSREEENES